MNNRDIARKHSKLGNQFLFTTNQKVFVFNEQNKDLVIELTHTNKLTCMILSI